MKLPLFTALTLCALGAIAVIPPSVPRLSVSLTNLPDAASQPITGDWNPETHELILNSGGGSGMFAIYCGWTVAITFPTQSNHTYGCEASDDSLRTWLSSSLRVIGTGHPVTLYDSPTHPQRAYRVRENSL